MNGWGKWLRLWGIVCFTAQVLCVGDLAFADTYQWVDKNGNFGFADSIEKVPPQYRSGAKKISKTPASKDDPNLPARALPPPAAPTPEVSAEDLAFEFQERYQRAQTELMQLKAGRQRAEEEYTALLRQRNLKSYAVDPEEEAKASAKIRNLDQLIQTKEYEVNTAIPDEARRAGVPLSTLSQ